MYLVWETAHFHDKFKMIGQTIHVHVCVYMYLPAAGLFSPPPPPPLILFKVPLSRLDTDSRVLRVFFLDLVLLPPPAAAAILY